jgi:hypothetical protein
MQSHDKISTVKLHTVYSKKQTRSVYGTYYYLEESVLYNYLFTRALFRSSRHRNLIIRNV